MQQLFVTLLNMSLTASWIVGAVVLFRLVFRCAPKWILCIMWVLVGLRLVIPGFMESSASLLPTTQPVEVPVVYTQPAVQHMPTEEFNYTPVPELSVTEQTQPVLTPSVPSTEYIEEQAQPETPEVVVHREKPRHSVFYWCSIAWLVGLCLMAAYCFLSYLRLHLQVREGIPTEKGIYICDRVNTPFILGLIRPKIFLPVNLRAEDKVYVLAHEFAHIRRKDHWWKPIGFLILSVYWFNPAMWLAYILLCRDIEGACDEKVIKELGENEKKPYSNALINCSAPARLISACPLAFGEGKLRCRIKSVLHYKKPSFWIILVCIVVGAVISAVFLTDPIKDADAEIVTYRVENITGPTGYVWDIDYPTLKSDNKDYTLFNNRLKKTVNNRLNELFDVENKGLPEKRELEYTVSCSEENIFSFYYEGEIAFEDHNLTRIKIGFTFDPETGQQLTIRSFTPITETLMEFVHTAAMEQLEDSNAIKIVEQLEFNLCRVDQHDNNTSFYIEEDRLCIVFLVSGSNQTVCLDLDELETPHDMICHFSASGCLKEQKGDYKITVYSPKGEDSYSSVEVFLKVESLSESHIFDLGVCTYAPLKEGALHVADIDGDGIDEILLNLVRSVNGYTTTYLYRFEDNELVLWHDLENKQFLYHSAMNSSIKDQQTTELKTYNIPTDYFMGESFVAKVYNTSVEDIDGDGDYEIKYTRFLRWPVGLEEEVEITLDYIKSSNKIMSVNINYLTKRDYSKFEVDPDVDDTAQTQKNFEEIWQIEYPRYMYSEYYHSDLHEIIKESVRSRFENLYGKNPNITEVKINCTITSNNYKLLSFYYEGYAIIDRVTVSKFKLGFTFNPLSGEQLYLSDFVDINDEFSNQIKEKWYSQIDETFYVALDDPTYSKYILSSAKQCDYKYSATSFFVDESGLHYICSVERAVGSYHTLYFSWGELWQDTEFYRYYVGPYKP